MTALSWVIHLFFGCHHRELSRVFTINKRTYQVCFECGLEIDYSLERMVSLPPSTSANQLVPLDNGRCLQAPII
jgi:hypothetical protein